MKPHEEDKRLIIPSYFLAFFALVSGFFNSGGYIETIFEKFNLHSHVSFTFYLLPLIFSISGILLAMYFYYVKEEKEEGLIFNIVENKFYVDKILSFYFVKILFKISEFLERFFEIGVIDGLVNGTGKISLLWGKAGVSLQKGSVRFYLKILFTFVSLLIFFFLFRYI